MWIMRSKRRSGQHGDSPQHTPPMGRSPDSASNLSPEQDGGVSSHNDPFSANVFQAYSGNDKMSSRDVLAAKDSPQSWLAEDDELRVAEAAVQNDFGGARNWHPVSSAWPQSPPAHSVYPSPLTDASSLTPSHPRSSGNIFVDKGLSCSHGPAQLNAEWEDVRNEMDGSALLTMSDETTGSTSDAAQDLQGTIMSVHQSLELFQQLFRPGFQILESSPDGARAAEDMRAFVADLLCTMNNAQHLSTIVLQLCLRNALVSERLREVLLGEERRGSLGKIWSPSKPVDMSTQSDEDSSAVLIERLKASLKAEKVINAAASAEAARVKEQSEQVAVKVSAARKDVAAREMLLDEREEAQRERAVEQTVELHRLRGELCSERSAFEALQESKFPANCQTESCPESSAVQGLQQSAFDDIHIVRRSEVTSKARPIQRDECMRKASADNQVTEQTLQNDSKLARSFEFAAELNAALASQALAEDEAKLIKALEERIEAETLEVQSLTAQLAYAQDAAEREQKDALACRANLRLELDETIQECQQEGVISSHHKAVQELNAELDASLATSEAVQKRADFASQLAERLQQHVDKHVDEVQDLVAGLLNAQAQSEAEKDEEATTQGPASMTTSSPRVGSLGFLARVKVNLDDD